MEGTAAVITRRILQAKGLDAQKDLTLLSMDTSARLQSLMSGRGRGWNDDATFHRGWNRALKFYADNSELMIPYIQKTLGVKETQLGRRMYDDVQTLLMSGILSNEAAKEILDTGREALRIKEPVSTDRIFDFSLAAEALN